MFLEGVKKHMISNQTQRVPDLLIITGSSQSGKNSLRAYLNNTLDHLTYLIRSTKTIQNPDKVFIDPEKEVRDFNLVSKQEFNELKKLSEIEADHPLAFAANHDTYDGVSYGITNQSLEDASKSGKNLAIAFVDPVNLDKVRKTYEQYGGKVHTALLKATATNNSNHNSLLKLTNKVKLDTNTEEGIENINLTELDVAAEDRAIKSRMRARGISEKDINARIKYFTEPEQKAINHELNKRGIDFIIQNLGHNKSDEEYGVANTMQQVDKLIKLLLTREESLRKEENSNYSPENPRNWDNAWNNYTLASKKYTLASKN